MTSYIQWIQKTLKLKFAIDLLGSDYQLSDDELKEIELVFPSIDITLGSYKKIICTFIKYKLTNYKDRVEKLLQYPPSSNCIECMKLRYGDEEGERRYKNQSIQFSKRSTLSGLIEKYGIDEGTLRYNKIISKMSYSHSLPHYIEKYGEDSGKQKFDEYCKSRAITLENMIRKYGNDEGTRRYNEWMTNSTYEKTLPAYIKKYGRELGKQKFDEVQSKKLLTLETFISRHGEELGRTKWTEFCKRNEGNWTLERQIELHGEELGTQRHQDMMDNVQYTSSLESYIENHGEEIGTELWYDKLQKMWKTSTAEAYELKYGENWREYKDHISKDALIKRYGNVVASEKYIKHINRMKYIHTLPYFIEIYGLIDGPIKLQEYKKSIICSMGKSGISQTLFDSIYPFINEQSKIHTHYADLNNEFIKVTTTNCYFYDFVISNLKYCIEFNGDMWHANPLKYQETDHPNPFAKNITAKDIWANDGKKLKVLTDMGYRIRIVWESDYRKNKENIIRDIIKEIGELQDATVN